MMKLLSASPSPYARKVRIALAEKGLPFELLTEVPWNADTTTPRYNPLEKLPVLILEDGTTVYESRHILEYLEVKFPHPPMFPEAPDDFLAAKRLEVLADGICDAAVLVIFERMRPQDSRSVPWEARQRRKIEGGFTEVARLVPTDGYCVGGRLRPGRHRRRRAARLHLVALAGDPLVRQVRESGRIARTAVATAILSGHRTASPADRPRGGLESRAFGIRDSNTVVVLSKLEGPGEKLCDPYPSP